MITFKSLLKLVLLISFAAISLNLARLGLAENLSYLRLNWNLFLALIPIFFAWIFVRSKNKYVQSVMFLLWIGFLPNAPYLVTDFIHLADVGPKSILWYDGIMIFMYTLAGMMAWIGTTYLIQQKMKWNEVFIVIIGFLSGFGIYLGRYIRFNTWDILTHPLSVFETVGGIIISPANHQPMLLMIMVTTFIFIIFSKLFIYNEETKN